MSYSDRVVGPSVVLAYARRRAWALRQILDPAYCVVYVVAETPTMVVPTDGPFVSRAPTGELIVTVHLRRRDTMPARVPWSAE